MSPPGFRQSQRLKRRRSAETGNLPQVGLLRSSEDLHAERLLRQTSVWLVDLVSDFGFVGGVATLWLGAGRTYPVMATHRRMLKAIAAMVT